MSGMLRKTNPRDSSALTALSLRDNQIPGALPQAGMKSSAVGAKHMLNISRLSYLEAGRNAATVDAIDKFMAYTHLLER